MPPSKTRSSGGAIAPLDDEGGKSSSLRPVSVLLAIPTPALHLVYDLLQPFRPKLPLFSLRPDAFLAVVPPDQVHSSGFPLMKVCDDVFRV
eukprot:756957-Hanusia_phi.AAC.3